MKIRLAFVIFIIFACYSKITLSQIYWAPNGAKWYISKPEGHQPPNEGYIEYNVFGDTVINKQQTKIIKRKYFHSNGIDVTPLSNIYTYSSDSIVYQWINNKFHVLYNFKAKPGDSWEICAQNSFLEICNYDSVGNVVVDSIGYTNINSKSLKTIYTSTINESKIGFGSEINRGLIIEGIGNIEHPLPRAYPCYIDMMDEEGTLRAYQDSIIGTVKFGYCKAIDCDCKELKNYSIEDNLGTNMEVLIFPNPFDRYLNIEFSSNKLHSDQYILNFYSLDGSLIKSYKHKKVNDLHDLPKGTYLLKINLPQKEKIFKIYKK